MPGRIKSKHKASRERTGAMGDANTALAELEALIAAGLKDGTLKEGGPEHLKAKREARKLRDSINLSRRRCP